MQEVLFWFLMVVIVAIPNVTILREVIFSIFVSNLSKSKHRLREAQKVHRLQPIAARITFSYCKTYIIKHKKDFLCYSIALLCYLLLHTLVLVAFGVAAIMNAPTKLLVYSWAAIVLINCLLFCSVYALSKSGPDHRTKYDRNN